MAWTDKEYSDWKEYADVELTYYEDEETREPLCDGLKMVITMIFLAILAMGLITILF